MAFETHLVADLSDEALTDTVKRLARDEQQATAQLVASLAEFDARRLYLGAGCASLFAFCTQVLYLAEHAAYNRIEAARAARTCPVVLERLAEGAVTLTAVRLLAPHLTADNAGALLDAVRHRSKRDVELLVAGLHAQPAVPASVRRLPASSTLVPPVASTATTAASAMLFVEPTPSRTDGELAAASPPPAPPLCAAPRDAPRAIVRPLAPERYRVQFTASPALVEKLRRAQDLLRHTIPSGDPALVFERALTVLLAQLQKATFAATDRPRRTPSPRVARATSPPRCGGRSGPATMASAPSSGPKAAAANAGSFSSITWSPTPSAARRRSNGSRCAVRRTTATRPSWSSAAAARRRHG